MKSKKIAMVLFSLLALGAVYSLGVLPFSFTGDRIYGEWNEYKGEMLKVRFSLSGVDSSAVLLLPKASELKLSESQKVVTLKDVEISWKVLEPYSTIELEKRTYNLAYSVGALGGLETTANEYKPFKTSWLTTTQFELSLKSGGKLIQEPTVYQSGFGEQFTNPVIGSGNTKAEIEHLGWLSRGVGDIATDFVVVLDPQGQSRIFKKTEYDQKVRDWNAFVDGSFCIFAWTELSYSDFWYGKDFTGCANWNGIGDIREFTSKLGSSTVTRVEISDSTVRAYRPAGAYTSEVVMWFTGDLAGAELREVRMDARVKDISTSPSSIRVKEGTTTQMDVVVSNDGFGDGNIDVTLSSSTVGFSPGSKTLFITKGDSNSFSTTIIPQPVTEDTPCDITITANAAGGSKSKSVSCLIENVEGQVTTPIEQPTGASEVSITGKGITFKGSNTYYGRVLAIGLNTDTEMTSIGSQIRSFIGKGNVEWVFSSPLSPYTKFNLVNTDDEDRFTYIMLLEANFGSEKPADYYLNGEIKAKGATEYNYTNPMAYLLLLLPFALILAGIYIRRKK